jgi:hypothetical protein
MIHDGFNGTASKEDLQGLATNEAFRNYAKR